MFKKTLLALGLCLAVTASALAAVTEKVEQGNKYKLSYPVFKLENRAAAKAINKDIKRMVLEQKKLAKSKDPSYVEVGTNYEIFSETDDYVNIIFVKWDYMGGAHGMIMTMAWFIAKLLVNACPTLILLKPFPQGNCTMQSPNTE